MSMKRQTLLSTIDEGDRFIGFRSSDCACQVYETSLLHVQTPRNAVWVAGWKM
jgi:hypothetical protein